MRGRVVQGPLEAEPEAQIWARSVFERRSREAGVRERGDWNETPPAQLSNGGGDEGDGDAGGAGGLRQVAQVTAAPFGQPRASAQGQAGCGWRSSLKLLL